MFLNKIKKIEIVSFIILIGFFSAVAYSYVNGYYFHKEYPYNTFLFNPDIKFSDFFSEVNLAKDLGPYDNVQECKAVYFPFAYIVFYFLSLLGPASHLYTFFIFIGFILFLLYKYIKPSTLTDYTNIFIITFLSYPILFTIDRGNIETIVFLFTGLFLYYFDKNDKKAILFLSFAVSMKLYPLIFASLYLLNFKLKYFIYVIVFTLLITVLSLLLFSNDVAHSIDGITHGQLFFKNEYVLGNGGIAYQNSLWGGLRIFTSALAYLGLSWFKISDPASIYMPYMIVIFLVYSGLLWFMYYIPMSMWEKITIISFSMILFPYVSFDYKLIYILFPLLYFIHEAKEDNDDFRSLAAVVFGLLLIPKNYYYLISNVSVSTLINPLLMLILIIYILFKKYQKKSF